MLNCYSQLSSSVIFRQYGVSQSECKIDRPRPGLSRLPPRPHTKALGTRLGSCIGIKLLRGYKWLIPTFEAMVMVLVDMVEDCIENQTQCTWIIFKASGHIRVPTVHGRPVSSTGYIRIPYHYICFLAHRQSSLVFANN